MYTHSGKEIYFNEATPEKVKQVLISELHSGNRLRLYFGDPSGIDWNEELDVMGYIGISTGEKPILLLIPNKRSSGGSGILTHCVVKITKNKQVLYMHPEYQCKEFRIIQEDEYYLVQRREADRGEAMARFKTQKQAQNYIDYMRGLRDSK